MKLIDFLETVYKPTRLLGKSKDTSRLYRISIRNFGRTIGKVPELSDLTDTNLILHMQAMLDAGRTPATANKDRSQLLTLWRHAHRLGMVQDYPNVPQLVEPQRTPEAWLPEQIAKLLEVADDQDGHFGPVPRSLWWRSLILTALDTGERIGALRVAQWSWISGDWLNVPAEARKGRRRDRAYRLGTDTIGHLQAIRLVSPRHIWPWQYSEGYLWRLFGELLESAELPSGRRDKFHKLRRTTASVVNQAGLSAQEALDHSHRRVTQRYLDPRFNRSDQPCDVLATFLEMPKKKKSRGTG